MRTKLKKIRNILGLTQKQAASLVHVSLRTWQQWESGEGEIHPAIFELLSIKAENYKAENFESFLANKEITYQTIKKHHELLAEATHIKELNALPSNAIRFIDLFAGIGGIRIGLQQAGAYCVFSSEIDTHAQLTYFTNHAVVPHGDITKIQEESVPEHDILCAGFPCQPFSHIGKREGFKHPTQGTMFHEVARIIAAKRPRAVFLENVPGLINHDSGRTLQVILDTLTDLGYECHHSVLNAYDFGVPQNRKRFYLVAFLGGNRYFSFPESPMKHTHVGDILENNVMGYSISKHLQDAYLFKKEDGRPILIDASTRGPMKTLVSSYHKIQRLTGTFVRDGETGIRLLSELECKRAMGFPDDFKIPVSRTQMFRQMGNSVVIPVIHAIAENIIAAFECTTTNKPKISFQKKLFDI